MELMSLVSMLSVGSSVRIHPNAPSTHAGMTGKVVVMPVHPITWFKVKIDNASDECAMFRSSNLIPLDERGEVRQDYLLSRRLGQAQARDANETKVPPHPTTTALDGGSGGRPVRKRSTTEDDADPYVVESDYIKPRKTRPYTAPTLPSASNRTPAVAAFDAYGACLNCGVVRWTAGRFCWNELCTSSPIYWKLPGCRGGQIPAATEVAEILAFMALSSVAGPSPAAPQRVRADSNISSDGSGIFASSESSSSLQSLM